MTLEFKECATCDAKPGSPSLCESCLHNRDVVYKLQKIIDNRNQKLSVIGQVLRIQ